LQVSTSKQSFTSIGDADEEEEESDKYIIDLDSKINESNATDNNT